MEMKKSLGMVIIIYAVSALIVTPFFFIVLGGSIETWGVKFLYDFLVIGLIGLIAGRMLVKGNSGGLRLGLLVWGYVVSTAVYQFVFITVPNVLSGQTMTENIVMQSAEILLYLMMIFIFIKQMRHSGDREVSLSFD